MIRHLLNGQRAAIWYVLLVVCVPLLTLIALGLVQLWQNQWLLMVSVVWLVTTLTGYALYTFWPDRAMPEKIIAGNSTPDDKDDAAMLLSLPVRLEPRPDWSALDRRVWTRTLLAVEHILDTPPDWQELPEHCIQLLSTISENYRLESQDSNALGIASTRTTANSSYSFTLPEMLLVLSVTSSRYRALLLDHVPFADRIKVSSLISLYSRQHHIKKGAGWLNTARRAARLVNPVAAITAELRDQFTNRIFTNLSTKVQLDLKRLLLQELSQVAMDLYSGRLKHSTEELTDYLSQAQVQDAQDVVAAAEPLRVVVIGQVSSGKSSLVNALLERLEAETGRLPTTDKTTVHVLQWDDDTQHEDDDVQPEPLHLIDTIGLVDNPQSVDATSIAAQQADLLIWVTRATQPARAPDAALNTAIAKSYNAQPDRRPPPMLLVMTHIDQLSPRAEWNPPYDLDSDNRKAQTISLALKSCKHQIGLPDYTPAIPVCLADGHEPYNIDEVAAQMMTQRADAAQTQFNRRRTEQSNQPERWRERWEQASKLGTVTGKLLARSVKL